MVVTTKKSN